MAQIKRTGFAQVEPNHLSGIVTGQILAQLPTDASMGDIIENGRFAKYDYANGKVNLTGEGEWMLIYNEEQFYDERDWMHKDYAMQATDFIGGEMVPRLISTLLGDTYTTNAFGGANTGKNAEVEGIDLEQGNIVSVGANGWLEKAENAGVPTFQVVKVYTMADGQAGVKLMRIR